MAAKYSDGFKLIVLFFKEIGLYSEFREFCTTSPKCDNFDMTLEDPFRCFGRTTISNWLEKEKGIRPIETLYHSFVAWVWFFYRDYSYLYGRTEYPLTGRGYTIDIEKRKITINYYK